MLPLISRTSKCVSRNDGNDGNYDDDEACDKSSEGDFASRSDNSPRQKKLRGIGLDQVVLDGIGGLQKKLLSFLDKQREMLAARHEKVEALSTALMSRRAKCVLRQRELFQDMESRKALEGFINLPGDTKIKLLIGAHHFEVTLQYLRSLPRGCRLEVLFSGRHMIDTLGRSGAYFFDRHFQHFRKEVLDRDFVQRMRIQKSRGENTSSFHEYLFFATELPNHTGVAHLGKFAAINILGDAISIPCSAGTCDFMVPLPDISISNLGSRPEDDNSPLCLESDERETLERFAAIVASHTNDIYRAVSSRWSANISFLKRRERAVLREQHRLESIEEILDGAEASWAAEVNAYHTFRQGQATSLLVHLGNTGEKILSTSILLVDKIKNSKLQKRISKGREYGQNQELPRRWNVECIKIPVSNVRTFVLVMQYLRTQFPLCPDMPDTPEKRKELWESAKALGVLTRAWLKWFDVLHASEQWNLYYEELTFEIQ